MQGDFLLAQLFNGSGIPIKRNWLFRLEQEDIWSNVVVAVLSFMPCA